MDLKKIISNPLYFSNLTMVIIVGIYSLQWSTDYSGLNILTYCILFIIAVLNSIVAKIINPELKAILKNKQSVSINGVIVVSLLFIADVFYSKNIPLVSIFLNDSSYYKEINHIPSIYILYVGLTVYYSLYYFRAYLCYNKKIHLHFALFILCLIILGMGRSHLFICLTACTFLYINNHIRKFNKIPLKVIVYSMISFVFLFVLLSFIRPVTEERLKNSAPEQIFMFLGNAKEEVASNIVFPKLFPVYLYVASPIGNLNNLISLKTSPDQNLLNYFIFNFTPESIQKQLLGKNVKEDLFFINQYFNVGTSYWDPYIEFGFLGVIIFHFALLFILLFLVIISRNLWEQDIIFALIFSILPFSFFANVLVFDSVYIPITLLFIRSLLSKI
jgi:oligosaccharide repeat unit polymerase